jgi:hypothetical protein
MLHLQWIKIVHDFNFRCKITVLWYMTPCTHSLVDKFQCVRGTCCLRFKFRPFPSNFKMEAVCLLESLVHIYQIIRRYKITILVIDRKNLKYVIYFIAFLGSNNYYSLHILKVTLPVFCMRAKENNKKPYDSRLRGPRFDLLKLPNMNT